MAADAKTNATAHAATVSPNSIAIAASSIAPEGTEAQLKGRRTPPFHESAER
jgi:hypothetical protein